MRLWVEAVRGLIFPVGRPPRPWVRLVAPFCARCAEPYARHSPGNFLCRNCAGRRWALERVRAAYRAVGTVREVILRFKYEREYSLRPWLGRWMRDGFRQYYAEERWECSGARASVSCPKKGAGVQSKCGDRRVAGTRGGDSGRGGVGAGEGDSSAGTIKEVGTIAQLTRCLGSRPRI